MALRCSSVRPTFDATSSSTSARPLVRPSVCPFSSRFFKKISASITLTSTIAYASGAATTARGSKLRPVCRITPIQVPPVRNSAGYGDSHRSNEK